MDETDTIKRDKISMSPQLALFHLLTLHQMMAQPEDFEVVSALILDFLTSKTGSQYTSVHYRLPSLGPGERCHLVKFHVSIRIEISS